MFKIIRNILLIVIVAAGLMAAFQWKNYQKKVECRENALLYFQEEDYQKAIRYLQDGLKDITFFSATVDKDMSCYLAESYYQLGEYENAVELYNELIEKNPKEKTFYLLKGEAYGDLDETEKSVKVFLTGWEKTGDTDFLHRICESYMKSGDYENALKYAEEGVKSKSEHSGDFLYEEIVIYEKSQDYASAYEVAQKYVEQYPDDEKGKRELKFLTSRI